MNLANLLQQPTYQNLDANFEDVRKDLIKLIQNSTKEEILQGSFAQAKKGMEKYGRTIDDNLEFDPESYLAEEIFDAFVYLSNLQIKQKQNKD
jgi:hypothetical protein